MEQKGCLFVCWVLTLFLSCDVLGQVSSICRPNERFLTCGGCQKTCQDPVPVCSGVCKTGCYCNEGEVRNETGHCVMLSECPPVASTYLQTSEPRSTDTECPENEEYRFCEPCNRTCDNPNPVCPAQCARGCFCVEDLLRDRDGRCVREDQCLRLKKNESSNPPMAYQLTCGPHQTYRHCQQCERTCSDPRPLCYSVCNTGCFCDDGYLKSPSGQCVKLEDCPKAEVSMGLSAQEPSVEDCQPDEVFLLCGWCEPSCSEPRPSCPPGVCTRGCLCRPPLLRHHGGQCVPEKDCIPQKCSSPNEEYVCRYGCEAKCVPLECSDRPRRCVLGCYCKLGLFRDLTGKCVTLEQCLAQSNNSFTKFNSTSYRFFDDILYPKTFTNVRPFVESANFSKTFMKAKAPLATDMKKADNESEGTTPKNLRDIISLARRFYKGYPIVNDPITPMYRDVDLRAPQRFENNHAMSSFRSMDVIPANTRMFKEDFIFQKDLDNSTSEDIVNASEFYKGADGTPSLQLPFKEGNLNTYLSEIMSVMKEMMPDPMNFTVINYPLW